MRLRTSDAPDGEGGNKWQRTGINDGLLTPIARAAEADPVSSPEGWGCFLSDQWLRFSFLQRTNESSCYGPHAVANQCDRRSAINLRWIFLMSYYRVYRVYRLENVHPLALPLQDLKLKASAPFCFVADVSDHANGRSLENGTGSAKQQPCATRPMRRSARPT